MKKQTKAIIALLTLCLMLPFMMIPTSATSATDGQMWSCNGKEAEGIITIDKDSPVILEKKTVTFDIQGYPKDDSEYFNQPFRSPESHVRVKYDLYNPTEEEITVRLALPFNSSSQLYITDSIDNYSVWVGGEEIDPEPSLSYFYDSSRFDVKYDPDKMSDGYFTSPVVNPDTTVTKYTFYANSTDLFKEEYKDAVVGTDIYSLQNAYIYLVDGEWRNENGGYRISTPVGGHPMFVMYVIGDDPITMPEWTIYQNAQMNDDETLDGRIESLITDVMTFNDFVSGEYSNTRNAKDLYNAYMYKINLAEEADRPVVSFFDDCAEMKTWYMGWYRWNVVLAPGERISTEAEMPIYPDIEFRYDPERLLYIYTLPSKNSWARKADVEININSPLYLIESNIGEQIESESGYKIIISNPGTTDHFIVTLSESENPVLQSSSSSGIGDIPKGDSVLSVILNIILFPFKLIYRIIYEIVNWLS